MFGLTQHSGTSRIRPTIAALCAVVMIAGLAGPALGDGEFQSQLPEANATSHPVVDLLMLRPLGMFALAGGATLFIPAALMTAMTRPQEISKPFGLLIVAPARYVWVDELGKH